MTRKDFQLIADTLSDLAEECPDHRHAFTLAATAFSRSLTKTNPRFDHGRFLEACGDANPRNLLTEGVEIIRD